MYTPGKCSKEHHYFLTWEIFLCLMNLYISEDFYYWWVSHGPKFRNREVSFHWQRVYEGSRWTWNDTIGTIKIARKNSKLSPIASTIIENSGLFPIIRGWWITVQDCARRKRISIICVLRIFQAYRGISRVWFTRLEQRWNEGQTFQRASGNRCLHKAAWSWPPRKQQRRQRQP